MNARRTVHPDMSSVDPITDQDLSTGSTTPVGIGVLQAVSPNGNHLLSWTPLGTFRWSR